MSLLRKWLPMLRGRAPAQPRVFTKDFLRIGANQKLEEENLPHYKPARYYPVRIGEVFTARYQVVGKLGFGMSSTVWLARDLNDRGYVAIKVFTRDQELGTDFHPEIKIYEKINSVWAASKHPGRTAIRSVLDDFSIRGPSGEHHCLVHPPLWESTQSVLWRNPVARFPPVLMATMLWRLFLALDFLHTECHIIHTDIKGDNIVYSLDKTDPVLAKFERDEAENPSPRKEAEDGRFIYASRRIDTPQSLGYPVLCDFGAAELADDITAIDAQPDAYRSPEMMLKLPWDYSMDIWNVGCMVWDMCQGSRHLFEYKDPATQNYDSRFHMASIISLLGLPPPELIQRSTVRGKYFNDQGQFDCVAPAKPARSWDEIETSFKDDKDRDAFLRLMLKMIEWVPEKRATAAQLLEDEWIKLNRSDKQK